jgi:hypothetical protein
MFTTLNLLVVHCVRCLGFAAYSLCSPRHIRWLTMTVFTLFAAPNPLAVIVFATQHPLVEQRQCSLRALLR